jgi:tetratricopeptide (TPR) repeat protein
MKSQLPFLFLAFICTFHTVFCSETGKKDPVFTKGEILYSKYKYSIASEFLQKAVQNDPMNHTAYFYLGNIGTIKSNFSDAEKNYQKAIELHSSASYYHNYGQLKIYQGFPDIAKSLFSKAISLEVSKNKSRIMLAQIHIHEYEYQKAADELTQALTIEPNHPDRITIQKLIDKLRGNIDFARKKREEKFSSGTPTNQPFNINVDLSDIGEKKELESKDEKSLSDIDIDLEIIE